jgi:pimeloyl-ACP methyl ester carboxylesterase
MKNLFIATLVMALALLGSLAACSKKDNDTAPAPTTFVLVHGAWQAPYAWQFVKQQLEAQGQTVVVVELPGHGADQTAPATLTLNSYRDKVVAAITALPGKVVLVGHSLGGMVITQVAEAIPDRISKLVYLGAFLPANGQSTLALASTDPNSLLVPAITPSADQLTLGLPTASLVPIFIQDGSTAVQQLVVSNYRPEPAIPLTNPAVITAANFGKVAKYYIYTTQDHALTYNLQQRMVAAAGITNTYQLNSSHSPFLSIPTEVTALLLTIAK